MSQSLAEVDAMIGSIMDGLDQRNLTDIINLVVVVCLSSSLIQSDHGMATTSNSRIIYLDSLLNLTTIDHIDCWPLKGLRPKPTENITTLYTNLKSLSENQPWNVYLRDLDMPPQFHFSTSYRIAPLYLIPDPEWVIVNSKAEFDPARDGEYKPKGIHGYDNDNELMRSLFLGQGPGLKYNYTIKPFGNTEVYGILMNLLALKPNPHNGTFKRGRMQKLSAPKQQILPAPVTDPIGVTPPTVPTDDTVTIGYIPATGETGATGSTLPTDGGSDMSVDQWEEIEEEEEVEEVEEDMEIEEFYYGRPLTWKEYLDIKAEEMKEEMQGWWDWVSASGIDATPPQK
jgi:Type I phosphodiesterase / nucleotide pyrophosphatase